MVHKHGRLKLIYDTAFVVNPAAGGGHAGRVWPQLAARLDVSGQPYQAYFTNAQGTGAALAARAAREGAELVVAIGGDGTLREVVNGIDFDKTLFGIIPLGTGNGFRRSCGIPGNWEQALQGLAEWKPRNIDVGKINGSYFLNVVGIGFDAAVAEMAADKYSKIKGYGAYLAAFFEELMKFDYFCVTAESPGLKLQEKHALLALVANGAYYGGSFSIAPQASIDDGKLDLLVARKRNNPETTLLAVKVLTGTHIEDSGVLTHRDIAFEINADHEVPVHIDGDVIGSLPANIEILPAALQLMAPPAK
jgi:diacylglycerol kinase (ATP)